MAKSYIDPKTQEHRPMDEGKGLNGTARYASINAHEGRGQSRRDDLESLGYVLTFLSTGSLIWQGLKNPATKNEDISKMKRETPVEHFCSGFPAADALRQHIEYSRNLQYADKPDYEYLKRLYGEVLEKYQVDTEKENWDWNQNQQAQNVVMAGDRNAKVASGNGGASQAKSVPNGQESEAGAEQHVDPGNVQHIKKKEKGNACKCIIS